MPDWVQVWALMEEEGGRCSSEEGGSRGGRLHRASGMVGPEPCCPALALESRSLMQDAILLGLHVIVLKRWESEGEAGAIAQWQGPCPVGGSGEFGPQHRSNKTKHNKRNLME